ncbi:FliH/SctL family protein [Ideonella sp.]|jgi:flagellar assembly protein FliH|uniref:FliH/SctL family protein n=1 Tax=Ideonella sp. TaxID=1929293 RepID=UPI0037C193E8
MAESDTTARPHNPYARFIPREELKGFAAWRPDSFGAPKVEPEPEAPLEPPEPPPPTTDEWLARIEEARQAGYHNGYRDGLEALEAAKRQFAQQTSAEMASLVAAFQSDVAALEDRMAHAVLDTSLRLARQVVRSELALRPDAVAQVAREAVSAVLLTAQHLRLRMHPQDLALIESGAGDDLRARKVLLLADAALSRGGCVVETDMGEVDARVESRWQQAAGVFGLPLDWATPAPPAAARGSAAAGRTEPVKPVAAERAEQEGAQTEPMPDLGSLEPEL